MFLLLVLILIVVVIPTHDLVEHCGYGHGDSNRRPDLRILQDEETGEGGRQQER
ncbi:hypothetical protein Nm8I071_66400 [Nonomuraea sp. TT08I-71]|nr:hypothetical protein Nm8I071_66400 [Nonomuraea sp. TT08I-71]